MWPTGNTEAQLARLDDALMSVAVALQEARANDEMALVCDLEARYDELLDRRLELAPVQ